MHLCSSITTLFHDFFFTTLQPGAHLQDVLSLLEGHVLGSKLGHEHGFPCHLLDPRDPLVYCRTQVFPDHSGYKSPDKLILGAHE